MSEYVKDPKQPTGWRVISYNAKGKKSGSKHDGAPITAEGMDEEAGASDGGEEAPDL